MFSRIVNRVLDSIMRWMEPHLFAELVDIRNNQKKAERLNRALHQCMRSGVIKGINDATR